MLIVPEDRGDLVDFVMDWPSLLSQSDILGNSVTFRPFLFLLFHCLKMKRKKQTVIQPCWSRSHHLIISS